LNKQIDIGRFLDDFRQEHVHILNGFSDNQPLQGSLHRFHFWQFRQDHSSCHLASYEVCPVWMSTFRGTDSGTACSITLLTRLFISSSASSGTSKINSSWTCRSMRLCTRRFSISRWRRTMAVLMMSAAVP